MTDCSAGSIITSFDTFWGNALQGIKVKWEHSGPTTETTWTSNPKEAIAPATDEISMTFDISLYGVGHLGIDTENNAAADSLAFQWYILFQNPYDINTAPATADADSVALNGVDNVITEPKYWYNTMIPFDGLLGTLDWAITDAIAGGDAATVELNQPTDDFLVDIWCAGTIQNGFYDSSLCNSDAISKAADLGITASEWLGNKDSYTEYTTDNDSTTNYCTETWAVVVVDSDTADQSKASPTYKTEARCVRVQVDAKRLMVTGENGLDYDQSSTYTAVTADADNTIDYAASDIYWAYRSYSVSAGWIIAGGADTPMKQDFAQIQVDFEQFTEGQTCYSGASSFIVYAGTMLLATAMAFAF